MYYAIETLLFPFFFFYKKWFENPYHLIQEKAEAQTSSLTLTIEHS